MKRYGVGRLLGRGGFGATYLGWDENLAVRVAVKEYLPAERATRHRDGQRVLPADEAAAAEFTEGLIRFLDEARILAQFRHVREVVGVLDFFESNGTAYIVQEFLDGVTLRSLVRGEPSGRLVQDRALGIASPVLSALQRMHDREVLHRDVSPDNVMIQADGVVKLLDFGGAQRFNLDAALDPYVLVKRGYAAPEQYVPGGLGPWSDVYGIAATLYFALAGKPPPDAMARRAGEPLPLPTEFGARLDRDVERALVKGLALERARRFQTVAELRNALAGQTR